MTESASVEPKKGTKVWELPAYLCTHPKGCRCGNCSDCACKASVEKAKDFEGVDLACQRDDCRDLAVDLIEGEPLCVHHIREEERRIEKERILKKIEEKLHDLLDQEDRELFQGLRGKALDTRWKIDSMKWVFEFLQEQDTPNA